MKRHGKLYVATTWLMSLVLALYGCGIPSTGSSTSSESQSQLADEGASDSAISDETSEEQSPSFASLDDSGLLQYMKDGIYSDLENKFDSEDFIIENVDATYVPEDVFVSSEYQEELDYNSRSNIYFGYSLKKLDEEFQGTRYVFTPNDDGTTTVKALEAYDDTYDRALQDVAIGTGVILICVTVSVVTAGAGAAPIAMVFAASAKTGTEMALSSGVISAAAAGAMTGFKTGNVDEAMKAAASAGAESFKWGAITGALVGGASATSALLNSSSTGLAIPSPQESEIFAQNKYGGEGQVTFLDGEEVPYGTAGATRPDVVRQVGDHLEALEVKNYDLSNPNNVNELLSELRREVTDRIANLPAGSTQRIVLDTRGRGFSQELVEQVEKRITDGLLSVYPDIPIDVL